MFKNLIYTPPTEEVKRDLPLDANIVNIQEGDFEISSKGAKCDKFEYLAFNRQFNTRKKFVDLKDSLKVIQKNLVPVIVALIDDKYYLIDGQGRLACIYEIIKGTGQSFPLRVFVDKSYESKEELLNAVVNVNNTNTPWDIIDYLEARVTMEKLKNVSSQMGRYERLRSLLDEYANISYKTVIDVLGEPKNSVLVDFKKEWEPRFEEGIKVLKACENFPIEKIKYNNKIVKGVDWVSRNAPDVNLNNIFDRLKEDSSNFDRESLRNIIAGTAESVIGILLDINDSDTYYKSRQITNDTKATALVRASGKCEAMVQDRRGTSKRCTAKNTLEFHHDLAAAHNGSNSEANIRMLCSECNNGAKTNPVLFWDETDEMLALRKTIISDTKVSESNKVKEVLQEIEASGNSIEAEDEEFLEKIMKEREREVKWLASDSSKHWGITGITKHGKKFKEIKDIQEYLYPTDGRPFKNPWDPGQTLLPNSLLEKVKAGRNAWGHDEISELSINERILNLRHGIDAADELIGRLKNDLLFN